MLDIRSFYYHRVTRFFITLLSHLRFFRDINLPIVVTLKQFERACHRWPPRQSTCQFTTQPYPGDDCTTVSCGCRVSSCHSKTFLWILLTEGDQKGHGGRDSNRYLRLPPMNSLSEVPPEEKFIPPAVTRLGPGILIGDAATRWSSSALEGRPAFWREDR